MILVTPLVTVRTHRNTHHHAPSRNPYRNSKSGEGNLVWVRVPPPAHREIPASGLMPSQKNRTPRAGSSDATRKPCRFVVLIASLPRRALVTVPPHRTPDRLPERRSVVAEGSREGGMIHNECLFELVEHLDRLAQRRIEES